MILGAKKHYVDSQFEDQILNLQFSSLVTKPEYMLSQKHGNQRLI